MDPSPSPPDLPSPDHDMALVAANGLPNKRYRPSPAKTFQCRGYGECRMVFSRSEHLARHIRKHTGERPFSCHCSKQFSRLDNLRQHAQTVHADKQDENERMMRDLTSLHATMSAANKLGGVRTGRKVPTASSTSSSSTTTNGGNSASGPLILIKQEDVALQRPDTSTGYESGEAMYPPNGSSFRDQSHSFREPSQSFLAPLSTGAAPAAHSQSFLAYPRAHFQSSDPSDRPRGSSRPSTASGLADPHPRSLPPLAAVVSASLASPQTPPSPRPHSSATQHHLQQQQQQSLLPFPSSLAHYRRSSITHRPGTAPASASLFARSSFPDRSRLGSSSGRPDLSLLHSGFAGRPFGFVDHIHQQFPMGDSSELSPSPGNDPSPFFFNPPVPTTAATGSSPVPVNSNPRKRPFGCPDGPSDDSNQLRADRPTSSAGPFSELNYEYGTESRPQSRRLTVMELCNDDDSQPRPSSQRHEQQQPQQQHSSASSPFLLSTAPARTTSAGLVSSTSTLRLFDRAASPGSTHQPTTVFSRTSYAAAGTVGDGASGGRGAKEGGRRGSSSSFGLLSGDSPEPTFSNRTTPPSYTPPAILSTSNTASNVVSQRQQQQQYYPKQSHHSPKYLPNSPAFSTASNDSSCSPRSPQSDSSAGDSPFPSYARTSTRSTATTSVSVSASAAAAATVYATGQHISSSNAHTSSGISTQSHHLHHHHHHHRQRDAQVRASVSPHPGFGMRV